MNLPLEGGGAHLWLLCQSSWASRVALFAPIWLYCFWDQALTSACHAAVRARQLSWQ